MNIDNMNEEKKITIAILNYNGLRYLKKTIPILLFLNYSNYKIVIVDNNSTDGSVDFIKSLSNEKIVLVENDYNFGYSKGKNICVANSMGEYILLLDNDIFIPEHNILNDLLKKYSLLENPAFLSIVLLDNGSIVSKYYGIYYSFCGVNVHKKTKKIIDIISSKNTKNILTGSFNGGAVFFKKNIWNELGGYDELQPFMLDDFDIGIRAYIFGYNNYLFNNY